MRFLILLPVGLVIISCSKSQEKDPVSVQTEPPFWGTIFIDPDIITDDDPTSYTGITYEGTGIRVMYDRRVAAWITDEAYLFIATFDDGLSIEFQVNSEFETKEAAQEQVAKYAPIIGQLPTSLRLDVETSWIHKGKEPFGGGNNNLLIHIEQGEEYIRDGILAETFVHEAAHTSLDAYHASSAAWLKAQDDDPTFISQYAQDHPDREDVAESFLPYLAVTYRPDRISETLKRQITEAIPNRIVFFDQLNLEMYPIVE